MAMTAKYDWPVLSPAANTPSRVVCPVSVSVTVNDGAVHVSIGDKGTTDVSLEAKEPDLEAKLEGLETPRGWGLFLIERLVDEVITSQNDDGHVIELVMRLEAQT